MRSVIGGAAGRAGWGQFRGRRARRVSPPREILHTQNHLLRPVLLERTAINMSGSRIFKAGLGGTLVIVGLLLLLVSMGADLTQLAKLIEDNVTGMLALAMCIAGCVVLARV